MNQNEQQPTENKDLNNIQMEEYKKMIKTKLLAEIVSKDKQLKEVEDSLKKIKDELEKIRESEKSYKEQLIRMQADFENYKNSEYRGKISTSVFSDNRFYRPAHLIGETHRTPFFQILNSILYKMNI